MAKKPKDINNRNKQSIVIYSSKTRRLAIIMSTFKGRELAAIVLGKTRGYRPLTALVYPIATLTAKILYRNSKHKFPEKELLGHSPSSYIHVLCAIYIFPGSACLFCCRKIGGPIVGLYINRSQTHE
jgi:hypothetical protein